MWILWENLPAAFGKNQMDQRYEKKNYLRPELEE